MLLTADFDRTLTGPDEKIPQRNIESIRYFMDNGGTLTVNTGRSVSNFRAHMNKVPVNAPLLLYNGGAMWENGKLISYHVIDLPVWETLDWVKETFPDVNLEVQGANTHYFIHHHPGSIPYYNTMGWEFKIAEHGQDLGPFLKFSIFGETSTNTVAGFYQGTDEEFRYFRQIEEAIVARYGDKVDTCLAAPKILDVQPKGITKLCAARELQAKLGKKILVCVGDAENDLEMLRGADYAFCPADGIVAAEFPNVCPCGEGAVADVIYKKIPEILQGKP